MRETPADVSSGDGAAVAPVVITGATVLAMTGRPNEAIEHEALAFVNGTILAVGTVDEVRAAAGEHADVVELDGGVLVPGFIDAHHHYGLAVLDRKAPDLHHPHGTTTERVLERIERFVQSAPAGSGWLRAHGYDPAKLVSGRVPSRDELDEIAPDRPLLIMAWSLHEGVLNSRGLEELGWDSASKHPTGGRIERDRTGRLTGEIAEAAFFVAEAHSRDAMLAEAGADELWMQNAHDHGLELLSAGITRVADAAVPPAIDDLYVRAAEAGMLPVTVHRMPVSDAALHAVMGEDRALSPDGSGPSAAPSSAAKLFLDGGERCATCLSLRRAIAATASMARARRSGTDASVVRAVVRNDGMKIGLDLHVRTGVRLVDDAAIAAQLTRARQAGLGVAQHAVGNGAIDAALSAIEAAARSAGRDGGEPPATPNRIEHAVLVDDGLARRMADTGTVAVVQPPWVNDMGDRLLIAQAGHGLGLLAFRRMLDAGVVLAGSSDWPITTYDVLFGVQAACERVTAAGAPIDAEQAITAHEALHAYTAGSAFALGIADSVGKLAPGFVADIVHLARDPRSTPTGEISQIAVTRTWKAGALHQR